MKYATIIFFFLALLCTGEAKAELFDATIIDLQGNSITCQIKARVNIFRKEINPLSLNKGVKAVLPDGTKVKYSPKDIQRFILHKTPSGRRVFESHLLKSRLFFLEVMSKGAIPYYKHYYPHGYDGSAQMIIVVEDPAGKVHQIRPLSWRTQLTKMFPGSTYFERELKERNFKYRNLPQFLEAYAGSYAQRN